MTNRRINAFTSKPQTRPPSRVQARWRVGLTAVLLALALPSATAASNHADDDGSSAQEWTWNSATHPAGAGDITAGSLGGVYRIGQLFYIPTAGHMTGLGRWEQEVGTGTGGFGYGSHKSVAPDVALIATGTAPLAPVLRVSDAWQNAPIVDIAHPGSITAGQTVCHSGVAAKTRAAGGYRCGTINFTCTITHGECSVTNSAGIIQGGDSGGPVWQYATGGAKLLGWMFAADANSKLDDTRLPDYSAGYFVPIWALQNHEWQASETRPGYPTGRLTESCFVTTKGCIRS